MVHDSEYFKKRYKIFIRFLKENNLYEEYRKIIENRPVHYNTMLERRISTKGQTFHILMVAAKERNRQTRLPIYHDFSMFYIYSTYTICQKITKLKPKWRETIKKLENE